MASRRKKRRRVSPLRRLGRFFYSTVVAFSAVVVVGFCAYQFASQQPQQAPPPLTAVKTDSHMFTQRPEASGVPVQEGLSRKEKCYTILLACSDATSGNADTIMVGMYDTINQQAGLVSVPRDTITLLYRKINAAYHEGPEHLREIVSDLLGIPIDYYITADVQAFVKLVDEVGGVDFNIPIHMGYDDPTQDLSIHYEPGLIHLNGQQAMEVCRFRHSNDGSGSEYSDVGRTQTQQAILSLIAKKVLSNPQKIGNYIQIFSQYIKSDMPLENMLWFAEPALGFQMDSGLQTATLPGDGSVHYKGSTCYQLYPEQCVEIMNQMLNPYTTEITLDMMNIVQVQ